MSELEPTITELEPTATERLRALLTERGVEYDVDDTQVDGNGTMYRVTYVKDGYARTWVYEEPPDCALLVSYNHDLGAEDAIAVTLGSCNCTNSERTETCMLELRTLLIDAFEVDGRTIRFKEPIHLQEQLDSDSGSLIFVEYPDLRMTVFAEFQDDMEELVRDELANKWEWIVESDDDELTEDALDVKRRFLAIVEEGGRMSNEVPVLNASKAPDSEFYVMGCTLTVEHIETLGAATTENRVELNGYLSKEILEAVLSLTAKVVDE